MSVVVAFVSQKGGVGKSTLARGLGAVIAHAGLKVRIVDLDWQQSTVMQWDKARRAGAVIPAVDVRSHSSVEDAVNEGEDVDLLILDAPGGSNQSTLRIAEQAHLIVQPTGPSVDDLYPGVLLFHELVGAGLARDRLVFAICRTLSNAEEADARAYLEKSGYAVLPGALPERTGYRDAHNRGRAITETSSAELNERADALMLALMSRVAAEVKALRERGSRKEKRSGRGRP